MARRSPADGGRVVTGYLPGLHTGDEYHTDPDGWHADSCPWALAQHTGETL